MKKEILGKLKLNQLNEKKLEQENMKVLKGGRCECYMKWCDYYSINTEPALEFMDTAYGY